MPKGEPFTRLCQALGQSKHHLRADIHIHSNHSDGLWDPKCIPHLARQAGLTAISITDHDTLAAYDHLNLPFTGIQIIPGVEITCTHQDKNIHILGYIPNPSCKSLNEFLEGNRQIRKLRLLAMLESLIQKKVITPDSQSNTLIQQANHLQYSLGSRHLAQLLVNQKKANSIAHAFWKHLRTLPERNVSWPEIQKTIAMVHNSGGLAFFAHPPENTDLNTLAGLKKMGLDGVEYEYPEFKQGRKKSLREMALKLELLVSGGSDCHGDGARALGAATISMYEFEKIKSRVDNNVSRNF